MYACVSSSTFLVLNGMSEGYFRSSRGLKQGDPLLPYLFIMVEERLSRMIRKAENGYLSGFVVGNSDVLISHLQYINDYMIFCDADMKQKDNLRCILRCFEEVSYLKINLVKS